MGPGLIFADDPPFLEPHLIGKFLISIRCRTLAVGMYRRQARTR
jgi:hypothetical protein